MCWSTTESHGVAIVASWKPFVMRLSQSVRLNSVLRVLKAVEDPHYQYRNDYGDDDARHPLFGLAGHRDFRINGVPTAARLPVARPDEHERRPAYRVISESCPADSLVW